MAGAEAISGLARGILGFEQAREDRKERDYQQKLRKEQLARIEMQNKYNVPELETQALAAQLQMQAAQNKQLQGQITKSNLYGVFDRYLADGNVTHLNDALQDPLMGQLMKDVANFAPLTEQDAQLFQNKMGIPLEEFWNSTDKQKANQRFLKIVKPDRTVDIIDMQALYGATKYTSHLEAQKRQALEDQLNLTKLQQELTGESQALVRESRAVGAAQARITAGNPEPGDEQLVNMFKAKLRKVMTGGKGEQLPTTLERNATAYAQAQGFEPDTPEYNQARLDFMQNKHKAQTPPAPTAMSRDSELFASLLAKEEAGTLTPEEAGRLQFIRNEQGGTEQAKTMYNQQADIAVQPYLDLPYEEFRKDPEVRKLVSQLETLKPIDTQDKKDLKELATLSSVLTGDYGADTLTTEQTGIIDRLTGNVLTKVTEDMDTRSKNAYGAFINIFRNNLFGAALTEKEIEAFNEAYQTRSDKLGPVLSGLRAAASQLKAKFTALANLNHEAVIKYYSGTTGAQLQQAIVNIDNKLNQLQGLADGKQTGSTTTTVQPPAPPQAPSSPQTKPKAADFFGGL